MLNLRLKKLKLKVPFRFQLKHFRQHHYHSHLLVSNHLVKNEIIILIFSPLLCYTRQAKICSFTNLTRNSKKQEWILKKVAELKAKEIKAESKHKLTIELIKMGKTPEELKKSPVI